MRDGKRPRIFLYADVEEHNAEVSDIFSELSSSGPKTRRAWPEDENDGFKFLLEYDDDELKLLLKAA